MPFSDLFRLVADFALGIGFIIGIIFKFGAKSGDVADKKSMTDLTLRVTVLERETVTKGECNGKHISVEANTAKHDKDIGVIQEQLKSLLAGMDDLKKMVAALAKRKR